MSRGLGWAAVLFTVASFFDVVTTFVGIRAGAQELNPVVWLAWQVHPFYFFIVKGAMVAIVLVTMFCFWDHGSRGEQLFFRACAWWGASLTAGVVFWNVWQLSLAGVIP